MADVAAIPKLQTTYMLMDKSELGEVWTGHPYFALKQRFTFRTPPYHAARVAKLVTGSSKALGARGYFLGLVVDTALVLGVVVSQLAEERAGVLPLPASKRG